MAERAELIERLLKVKALAENGAEGEKETARVLLISLMDKYGFKDGDLNLKSRYFIPYNRFDPLSKQLLNQIAYAVLGKEKGDVWRHHRKAELGFDCTKSQAIEIEAKYAFYYEGMKKDMELLYTAFIMRNRIYPTDGAGDDKQGEPTEDDYKAYELSKSLEVKAFYKQLEE